MSIQTITELAADQIPDSDEERALIPDDVYLDTEAWAKLQGVKRDTVLRMRGVANQRARAAAAAIERGEDPADLPEDLRPWPHDIPPEDRKRGSSPLWKMSTFRAWYAARPGVGREGGRTHGSGQERLAASVSLPMRCPHCTETVKATDLPVLAVGEGVSKGAKPVLDGARTFETAPAVTPSGVPGVTFAGGTT